jgi:hypothetical protein
LSLFWKVSCQSGFPRIRLGSVGPGVAVDVAESVGEGSAVALVEAVADAGGTRGEGVGRAVRSRETWAATLGEGTEVGPRLRLQARPMERKARRIKALRI